MKGLDRQTVVLQILKQTIKTASSSLTVIAYLWCGRASDAAYVIKNRRMRVQIPPTKQLKEYNIMTEEEFMLQNK